MESHAGRALSPSAGLLVLLALVLYLPLAHVGAPHATGPDRVKSWGVDDETPLGPLAEMHNIVEPRLDRNLGYPLAYSFLCAAAYSPYFVYLWATGQFGSPTVDYPYGFTDPRTSLLILTWIAHAMSALLAALAVGATGEAARVLVSPRAGWVAGALCALSMPVVYYARTGNVDVPLLGFLALGIAAFARVVAFGVEAGRVGWLGAFIGLALATKEQAAAIFLAVPPALVFLHVRQQRASAGFAGWRDFEGWKAPLVFVLAGVLSFGLASGLFLEPDRYLAHISFGRERMRALLGGEIAFARVFPFTVEGNLAFARALGSYAAATFTVPGMVLAGGGLAVALWRRAAVAWLALPIVTYLLVLSGGARTLQLRYLMPLVPCVAIFAGYGFDRALRSSQLPLRAMGGLFLGAALATSGLQAAELSWEMARDSRYEAGRWIASRLRDGDRIAHFGVTEKLPPMPEGVILEHVTPYLGGYAVPRLDPAAIAEMEGKLRSERPEYVILVPDYTSPAGVLHSRSCPPEIFAGLIGGRLGYELAGYFETPPLFPWLDRPPLDYPVVNPPIHVFRPAPSRSPAGAGAPPRAPAVPPTS